MCFSNGYRIISIVRLVWSLERQVHNEVEQIGLKLEAGRPQLLI